MLRICPANTMKKKFIRDAQHQHVLVRKLSETDFSLTEKWCEKNIAAVDIAVFNWCYSHSEHMHVKQTHSKS